MDSKTALEKLAEEANTLQKQMSALDEEKNKIVTRLVEIQGVAKFLKAAQEGKQTAPASQDTPSLAVPAAN